MVWAEVRLTPEGPGMFTNVPSCGRGVGPGTAPLKNSPVALLIGEGMTVEKGTAALWSIPAEPRPKSAKPRAVGPGAGVVCTSNAPLPVVITRSPFGRTTGAPPACQSEPP